MDLLRNLMADLPPTQWQSFPPLLSMLGALMFVGQKPDREHPFTPLLPNRDQSQHPILLRLPPAYCPLGVHQPSDLLLFLPHEEVRVDPVDDLEELRDENPALYQALIQVLLYLPLSRAIIVEEVRNARSLLPSPPTDLVMWALQRRTFLLQRLPYHMTSADIQHHPDNPPNLPLYSPISP